MSRGAEGREEVPAPILSFKAILSRGLEGSSEGEREQQERCRFTYGWSDVDWGNLMFLLLIPLA